tara:strand:- start:10388 stop:10582 length:195 start_codon:yes stop_codon:yes gene_type:complete
MHNTFPTKAQSGTLLNTRRLQNDEVVYTRLILQHFFAGKEDVHSTNGKKMRTKRRRHREKGGFT